MPEKAYLYVRGHDLMTCLVNTVITPGVEFYRQKHYARLKDLDESQRAEMLEQYGSKQKSVGTLIYRNYRYKRQLEIYDWISRDVGQIWT